MLQALIQPFFLQAGGTGSNPTGMILMMVGFAVIFYFFMIRPQMARQKKEKQFRDSLKKDDKIITVGGVYGRIVAIEDNTILVEIDKDVKVRMERSAIRSYSTPPSGAN